MLKHFATKLLWAQLLKMIRDFSLEVPDGG